MALEKIVHNLRKSDKHAPCALINAKVASSHCVGTKRTPPVVPMPTVLPTWCVDGRYRPTVVQDTHA
jgi:hypothetical protein